MRNLVLHGSLAKALGVKKLKMQFDSVGQAMQGLLANFPHAKKLILDGRWHLVLGKVKPENSIAEKDLKMGLGKGDLHLMPEIVGAGGKNMGIFELILGVVLIVASIWFPPLLVPGLMMVLGGVMALMAPTPHNNAPLSAAKPDQRPSFQFSNAVNVTVQGGPVPLALGKCLTGSQVISVGVATQVT